MISKKELRTEILEKRNALTKEMHCLKSQNIAKRLMVQSVFKDANVVLLFASFRNEVDTTEIFRNARNSGKEVFFPKVVGKEMLFYRVDSDADFEDGRWGIREPKVEDERLFAPRGNDKICVIMPGAVFDKNGNRIGYGGGYYDKFLREIDMYSVQKVGICFECQLIDMEDFPNEEHDIRIDMLITESDSYKF